MKNDSFAAAIPEIERVIGYTFRDKGLLRQAFTRSSWCNEHPGGGYQSNEVLEFFGDTVLSAAIITFLLSASAKRTDKGIRTELGEGDFSNIKSKLSDKTNLSASMAKLGLERHLLLGEGDAKLGIAKEPSVMEDLFESIIGAVYIDSDKSLDMVTKVVIKMLDMSVYSDSSAASVSPKNALQEWCADKKRRLPAPVYRTISEEGPDHKKEYERGVYLGERLLASARGKNQKTADALAAKEALGVLMRESGAKETASPKESADTPAQSKPAEKASSQKQAAGKKVTEKQAPRKGEDKPIKKEEKKPSEKTPAGKAQDKPSEERPTAKKDGSAEPAKKGNEKKPTPDNKAANKRPDPAKGASEKGPARGTKTDGKGDKPALSASAALRAHAARSSSAGPVYRDLGLIDKDEHGVECSFMGARAIATAPTRPEAKEKASEAICAALGIKHR